MWKYILKKSKYLDNIGKYKLADSFFNNYIRMSFAQNNNISKDDFIKMINNALFQGTDQDPSTQMSQYKKENTPGSSNFDIVAYKAKSRQIMEGTVIDDPLFNRFDADQKQLILNYLDSFAQDPNSIHDNTSDEKKLNDLLHSFGYDSPLTENNDAYDAGSTTQQGLDRLSTAIWLAGLAKQAGFNRDSAVIAVAIVFPESDADPNNVSDISLETDCWGPSVGLWQTRTIKQLGCEGPNDDFRYDPDGRLFNPQNSAEAAYKESRGGVYWHPWTVYKTGAYKAYLEVAKKAVNEVYH